MSLRVVLCLFSISIIPIITKPAFSAPINLHIVSDSSWQSTNTFANGWETINFDDAAWQSARSPYPKPIPPTDIIAGTSASFIWYDPSGTSDGTSGSNEAFFRYTFFLNMQADSLPLIAQALVQVDDDYDLFVNGTLKLQNHDGGFAGVVDFMDFTSLLQNGKNVIAIQAKDGGWPNAYDRLYEDLLFDGSVKTASIPEPGSLMLLISGVIGLVVRRVYKRSVNYQMFTQYPNLT